LLVVAFKVLAFLFEQNYGYVVGGGGCVLVGGTRVAVGRAVRVDVGRGVLVKVARGAFVFAVNVMNTTGVTVAVRVTVGVGVLVAVRVGVSETVGVGAVDVGKGPSSAWEVSATAVRVRPAFSCARAASGCLLDVSAIPTRINPIKNSPINNTCRITRFSRRKLIFTRAALLIGTLPRSVAELAVLLTSPDGITM
jgi:hypothetical protein